MSRIIAGRLGGRRLRVPAGSATRPTSDRVREAVFSRLAHLDAVEGARVLDLYAGSGALGLEALSRGAVEVLLVDNNPRAAAACRANIDDLGVAARARVRAQSVSTLLAGEPSPVDLVFADPPYDLPEDTLAQVLGHLVAGWLTPEAVVVVERSSRGPEPAWPDSLGRLDCRRYGETTIWIAEPAPDAQREPEQGQL